MKDLRDRYRFFRSWSGEAVGRAVECIRLARAEQKAEERGLVVCWEEEDEAWDGDAPAPAACLYGAVFRATEIDEYAGLPSRQGATCYAALGMVGCDSYDDPYLRLVEAELFEEALIELDKEDQDDADALGARATWAMPAPQGAS